MNTKMTDLDRKLQEMALTNWSQFVQMLGSEAITAAKICMLRGAGSSYGEISIKLSVTEHQARYGCGKCEK